MQYIVKDMRNSLCNAFTYIFFLSLDINECHSDPCMNGATCEDGVFQYTCSCAYGYTGTHCETGECTSVACFIVVTLIYFLCALEKKMYQSYTLSNKNLNKIT